MSAGDAPGALQSAAPSLPREPPGASDGLGDGEFGATHGQNGLQQQGCFLCEPNPRWVWAQSDKFYAMAALGPIVPGTSLLATRAHVRSMFDVSSNELDELEAFTASCRDRLRDAYGLPVHTTEHGRVGLCEMDGEHDAHCYHAHWLLFPVDAPIGVGLEASIIDPVAAAGFREARRSAGHLVRYLYYEAPDGQVRVGAEDSSTPRQFFRGVVADAIGRPELRSWRNHPEKGLVDQTAAELR